MSGSVPEKERTGRQSMSMVKQAGGQGFLSGLCVGEGILRDSPVGRSMGRQPERLLP